MAEAKAAFDKLMAEGQAARKSGRPRKNPLPPLRAAAPVKPVLARTGSLKSTAGSSASKKVSAPKPAARKAAKSAKSSAKKAASKRTAAAGKSAAKHKPAKKAATSGARSRTSGGSKKKR